MKITKIKQLMDLSFNPENKRGEEILAQMNNLRDSKITNDEFMRRCLEEIPQNEIESHFISFYLGAMSATFKVAEAMTVKGGDTE